MSSQQSITICIRELKAGVGDAANKIWQRYSPGLMGMARKKLGDDRRRVADEEDVAQSAFISFWQSATAGRFSQLCDRNDLLPLLKVITERKALDYRQRERRQKRGSGRVRGDSVIQSRSADAAPADFDRFAGVDTGPHAVVANKEIIDKMLNRLGDDVLRKIALWKLHGHTDKEIAGILGCARSTVVRKLSLIRKAWVRELPE